MRKEIMITTLIAGLVVGGASAKLLTGETEEEAGYCDSLEANIAQNQSFEGTVDCFTPGQIETDLPEQVNESADLKCVCRKSYQGNVKWMNIAVSN